MGKNERLSKEKEADKTSVELHSTLNWMIGNLKMYDCQSLSIRLYQKQYIIPISAYIVSQTTQGSELQIFF